ncbi:MAG TPA: allantoicase [Streptosporangiaceae bacterium]|jgi:allantoicase
MSDRAPDFTRLPDLASRALGGSVVFANDDLFAEKENLIKPEPAGFAAEQFGPRGKVYDGWETRRRREPGHDHAIIRLGVPGLVHGVVVDTAWFRGNYPPEISVEGVSAGGYPAPAELAALSWQPLVARATAAGDTANYYPVADRHRWTHLRLSVYPDGGVARFRVHGEVVAAPAFLAGTVDLAALENGGRLLECSDAFYSTAEHLIGPGRAAGMADGWENARRRDGGNDYAVFALAAAGVPQWVEVDTSYFVGNAPGWVRLQAGDGGSAWREILPRTRVQPDTRHRLMVTGEPGPVTRVRLDVYPDGGLARLRVHGQITDDALAGLRERWRDTAAPDPV